MVDTGAAVSLISKKMYDNLFPRPKLFNNDIPSLQAANGNSLIAIGYVNISFKISGLTLDHKLYVTKGLNRNMILGRDWLKKNNVRLYFDLGLMRIDGKVYAELKEDLHISTIVRTPKKLIMRPNTVTVFYGKINNNFPLEKNDLVEVNSIDNNCIMEDPGLYLKDAVCIVRKDKKVPMIFVNQTNKNYKIPRGYIVGRITALKQKEISEIQTTQDTKEEIDVPKRFEHSIKRLVSKNNDLFAKKDSDLGVTDTVKMKIETGDHHPIKNRPYRVPLNKRQIIDKAILEMMDAKIIERSQSPWSFPLVVVKKKDGSDRMCVDFRSLNKIVKPVSFPLPLIDDNHMVRQNISLH